MKKAIKFSAPWCGSCLVYENMWNEVKAETENWEFEEVDVDSNVELVSKYGIKAVPTTILTVNDTVVHRQSGIISTKNLKDLLQEKA
jgi:thioredoxin 1